MKILVTGMNTAQCTRGFYLRQQLKVVTTQHCFISALEDMGHTVDHRHVVIGEDLSSYDKVVVFIHNPSGFATYVHNALWAIYARPDCILSIDDWQSDGIYREINRLLDPSKMFRPHLLETSVDIPDDIKKYEKELMSAVKNITDMQNKMIIAGVSGGDPTLMVPGYPKSLFSVYDPNPYTILRTPENGFGEMNPFSENVALEPKDKLKKWAFVSLMHTRTRKWLKSVNLSGDWEVKYFGALKGEFKSTRLTEDLMCAEYEKHWGCLTPKYFHAGSGFWRPRALQVAMANSILCVDDAEGKLYSPSHVGVNPVDVEKMSISQLSDLARAQKEGYLKQNPLDKNKTKDQLSEILNNV